MADYAQAGASATPAWLRPGMCHAKAPRFFKAIAKPEALAGPQGAVGATKVAPTCWQSISHLSHPDQAPSAVPSGGRGQALRDLPDSTLEGLVVGWYVAPLRGFESALLAKGLARCTSH